MKTGVRAERSETAPAAAGRLPDPEKVRLRPNQSSPNGSGREFAASTRRAVTAEEHARIIARRIPKSAAYYEFLYEMARLSPTPRN
jgi:hypothetical protein